MYSTLKELYDLLTIEQRKKFWVLQIFVILMALFELVGVASIAPFMSIVVNPSVIETNMLLSTIYYSMEFNDSKSFTIFLGLMVLISLTISSLVSVFTTWRLAMFGTGVGAELSQRLYSSYINENWLFHASSSSAQLTKQIATEAHRVTTGMIVPAMQLNSKIILIAVLSLGIFLVNPIVSVFGVLTFTIAYLVIYKFVRGQILINGKRNSEASSERFRLMNEGFGGVKDVMLTGRQRYFENKFKVTSNTLAYSMGQNAALTQVPRYILELVAFGALILLVISMLYRSDEGALGFLPLIAVYALAGFKILPAFQMSYGSVAQIKGATPAFESIRSDLLNTRNAKNSTKIRSFDDNNFEFKSLIELRDIHFTYPTKTSSVLSALNISIRKNQIIGLVGPSGSGKSTLIDILMCLINPTQGSILIDGVEINKNTEKLWQRKIGFVAQNIFLSEGTIAENIAFGYSKEETDIHKMEKVLQLSHLESLIAELPEGINTKVGERGIQLSGGQKQRIGIARALYHEADVLVFDEATSALDGITEKLVMDAIHEFAGSKTIIMIAHRLKTVEQCDQIYFLDKGKIIDQGTYQQLVKKNKDFRRMAHHA